MVLDQIRNFCNAFFPLLSLGNQVRKGRKDAGALWNEINNLLSGTDQSIDGKNLKKIEYYCIGHRIIGEWVASLRGYRLSKREIEAGKYLSVCTPLFDSIFDEHGFTEEEVLDFLSTESGPKEGSMFIMKYYLDKTLRNIKNKENFSFYFKNLREAQLSSLRQKDHSISIEDLWSVSANKGGYALLLSRSVYDNAFIENEKDAYFRLGTLIQYTNDIFDIHHDLEQGIMTLPIYHRDISIIRNEYSKLLSETIDIFQKTLYPPGNITRFRYQLLIITSRALVCLEILERSFHGHLQPVFSTSERDRFICDMDRVYNFWRSLVYTVKG